MGSNLAERVVSAPAPTEDKPVGPTLLQMIEQMKPQLARVLPNQMSPDRMARIAATVLRQTPLLGRCTPTSFLGALMTSSQLGLEPGPLGHAYFVPFKRWDKDSKREFYEVTFIPGYKGLIDLGFRSGQLLDISARAVHEGDEFEYLYGLDPVLRHRPVANDDAPTTHAYAVAHLRGGGSGFEVLPLGEIERVRKRSKASTNGPWVTDFDAMAAKSAVRRLAKFLPASVEMQQFHAAVALDGTVRNDVLSPVDEAEVVYADTIDETPAEQ